MVELIKQVLLAFKEEISGFKIVEENIEANELFFVRKGLDMDRAKKVQHFKVTVYKNFQEAEVKYTGSSTTEIHPAMNEEEIKRAIAEASFAAGFVKNEYYPLPKPSDIKLQLLESGFSNNPLSYYMPLLTDAVYKADIYEKGGINSTEVFLNKIRTRIINSEGIDVSFESHAGEIEFITDWKEQSDEIELYKDIRFSEPDFEGITTEVEVMINMAKERASASNTPILNDLPVLLTGEPVKEFFAYYYDQASAQYAYNNLSTAKVGENIQGSEAKGDLVSISLNPFLENSTASAPVDRDGLALSEVNLYNEGILLRYFGDVRHSYYLNCEPTGLIQNFVVKSGSAAQEELRKQPHLELKDFSSFELDTLTGNFAGEIRLGWYFDGVNRVSVAGGSISGNVNEVQKEMYFSKELQQINNFKGPKTIKLSGVSISGC